MPNRPPGTRTEDLPGGGLRLHVHAPARPRLRIEIAGTHRFWVGQDTRPLLLAEVARWNDGVHYHRIASPAPILPPITAALGAGPPPTGTVTTRCQARSRSPRARMPGPVRTRPTRRRGSGGQDGLAGQSSGDGLVVDGGQAGQPVRLELWCETAGMVPQLVRTRRGHRRAGRDLQPADRSAQDDRPEIVLRHRRHPGRGPAPGHPGRDRAPEQVTRPGSASRRVFCMAILACADRTSIRPWPIWEPTNCSPRLGGSEGDGLLVRIGGGWPGPSDL